MAAAAGSAGGGLPTAEEDALISRLRASFSEELSRREATGRSHPCFFGQLALARVLRGNDGNLSKAQTWFKAFLEKVEKCNLDELMEDMNRKLESAPSGAASDLMLPYADEVGHYIRAVFTAPEPTPEGDLVNYIPFVRFNKRAIYEKMEWGHLVRYMQGATVLRMIECDRLSRAQGRMVKVVTLFDLSECGFAELVCPRFDMAWARDVAGFQVQVAAEIFGPVYVLNTPQFVLDLYWVLFRFVPDQFKRKLHLLPGDGLDDPDFVRLVGGRQQLQSLLSTRDKLYAADEGLTKPEQKQTINRRRVFVHSFDVRPGQRVSWSCKVLAGSYDTLLGESDLEFSVSALWTARAGQVQPESVQEQRRQLLECLRSAKPEALVRTQTVSASQGKVTGSHLVERPGVVTFRWSNRHGALRSKTLSYAVQLADATPVEAHGDDGKPVDSRPSTEDDGVLAWCCTARPSKAPS